MLPGLWDLNSPTRVWTQAPVVGAWSPGHWATREEPCFPFLRVHLFWIVLINEIAQYCDFLCVCMYFLNQLYWGLISISKRQTSPSGPYMYFSLACFAHFAFIYSSLMRGTVIISISQMWAEAQGGNCIILQAGCDPGVGPLQSPFCWPLLSLSFQISYMCSSSACFLPHNTWLSSHIDKKWP